MRSVERLRHGARRSVQRYFGFSPHTPQMTGVQRQIGGSHPTWMAFPEVASEAIQILDRADPDFGTDHWTMDYSPIG